MVRKAICVALSERNRNDAVKFVNMNSTKELKEIRSNILKDVTKKSLFITNNEKVKLALRNSKGVKVITPMGVNVKHIVNNKEILVEKEVVNILEERLLNGK